MDFKIDICQLTYKFYSAYPHEKYPEILMKEARPYTCLLIETKYDYFICIPFRSSILHNDAYFFKNTQRSKRTRSGLDYKKIVIIKDTSYISSDKQVVVDNDEYTLVMKNIKKIAAEADSYISKYVNHINGSNILHAREYERHYNYSTLPYFHDIIGLAE